MLNPFWEEPKQLSSFNEELARQVLDFQLEHNPWFRNFAKALNFEKKKESVHQFPFIPIDAFKRINGFRCNSHNSYEHLFLSSGTGTGDRAKHYVNNLSIYESLSLHAFTHLYPLDKHIVLAYLPAYIDNQNSSLVHMVNHIIQSDKSGLSCFLDIKNPIIPDSVVREITALDRKIILFGAAFGLVELADQQRFSLPSDTIIIETGGMKNHRKAMTRDEIKNTLAKGFNLPRKNIHSEYGMCELLSQAYEQGDGWYSSPPWMKVFIRLEKKPFNEPIINQIGQVYVADLANVYSCSFIQTQDIGIQRENGDFQILGRKTDAPLRGCNFLMEEDL